MNKIHIVILVIACSLGTRAKANSIDINYSFVGAQAGLPVVSGTTVTIDDVGAGSILSGNPSLNAIWNPVTWSDHSIIDLTTGRLNGTVSLKFADGDTLSGTLFEDVSKVLATNTGPIRGMLTFTGGTGDFADASGSVSGGGIIETNGWSISGSGTLNAAAIPEPASGPLLLGGLILIIGALRKSKVTSSPKDGLSPATQPCVLSGGK
jgi:hypothetical protein